MASSNKHWPSMFKKSTNASNQRNSQGLNSSLLTGFETTPSTYYYYYYYYLFSHTESYVLDLIKNCMSIRKNQINDSINSKFQSKRLKSMWFFLCQGHRNKPNIIILSFYAPTWKKPKQIDLKF